MTNKEKHKYLVRGFYVVGFRLNLKIPRSIKSTDEIDCKDYTRAGGILPLAEFPYPSDVFMRFTDKKSEGLYREIRRYDIINIYYQPSNRIFSLLVVDDMKDSHLWGPQTKVYETEIFNMLLMNLPKPINLKWK